MNAVIDGAAVASRSGLHENLAAALGLPVWYGHNLDALHDCLTAQKDLVLTVEHFSALSVTLGDYAQRFLAVLKASGHENPGFHFQVMD